MRYNEFEQIMSRPRMQRYLTACRGDTKKAMTLYWKMMRNLVNEALHLKGKDGLTKTKPKKPSKRIIKIIEEKCRTLPAHYPEFEHYLPVDYLHSLDQEDVNKIDGLDEALYRFELLFKKLNSLING